MKKLRGTYAVLAAAATAAVFCVAVPRPAAADSICAVSTFVEEANSMADFFFDVCSNNFDAWLDYGGNCMNARIDGYQAGYSMAQRMCAEFQAAREQECQLTGVGCGDLPGDDEGDTRPIAE